MQKRSRHKLKYPPQLSQNHSSSFEVYTNKSRFEKKKNSECKAYTPGAIITKDKIRINKERDIFNNLSGGSL